jgi:hypothetical protein
VFDVLDNATSELEGEAFRNAFVDAMQNLRSRVTDINDILKCPYYALGATMSDLFFEMRDDMALKGIRMLGGFSTPEGREVLQWDCRFGKRVEWAGSLSVKIIQQGHPLDLCSNTWRTWIASAKARRVLEALAPEAIQYIPLTIPGDSESYFVANIIRRVACLDEKLSHVERWEPGNRTRPDCAGQVSMIIDLHIETERAIGEHLFRLEEADAHVIVSKAMKEALEGAKINGVKFQEVTSPDIAEFRKRFAERQKQRQAM